MKSAAIIVFATAMIIPVRSVFSASGDRIRDYAPMTALILDAREGNEGPLLKAYFNKEIDFFLDLGFRANPAVRDLSTLRDIGRAIEAGNYLSAEQKLQSLRRFDKDKLYLRGVLDAAEKRYEVSLDSFRKLIDDRRHLSRHLASLSFMGAARIFHEIGDYKQAIYHYTQVRQLEPDFFEAVFEKAWSFYLDGDMNGALGVTLSFLSPYFNSSFFPEAYLVRAAAFFQLCYFDRASWTVEKFKKDWEPIRSQLQELRRRNASGWLFDDQFIKSIHPRIVGLLVSDTSFRSGMKAYLALRKESKKVGLEESSLNAQAISIVKARLVRDAERVLEKGEKSLQNVLAQMDIMQIEILQSGANVLLGRPPDESFKVKTIDLKNVDFDPLVQFWPFKTEFWVDELGSYYYGLKSNCAS